MHYVCYLLDAFPPFLYFQCTTSYFEGIIAMVEPDGSWVAKWQHIADFYPGMYAMEMIGELPEDVIEYCESEGIDYKARKKQSGSK